MADTITVVEIMPWPLFTGIIDGKPAVGSKLYSYAPSTSVPKATYSDAGLVNANPNPTLMDDQGQAMVHLDGLYKLRFTSAEDVLYWEVDQYQWPTGLTPPEGDLIMGSTEATLQPTPGAPVLTFGNMAPAGYRIKGTTWTISESMGTANGVSSILLGDQNVLDRWGQITDLTAGQTGGQLSFKAGDEPISPTSYTLLATAVNGTFDGTGSLHCTVFWESLPADTP